MCVGSKDRYEWQKNDKIVPPIGTYLPIKYDRQFFVPAGTLKAVKLIMQIMDADLNNVYVIDVNDGINANNVILISLWMYYIISCICNTIDSPRGALPPSIVKLPTTYL
jgi:hypothetical protein